MTPEAKKEIELEIAYVLFIDMVGYSKLRTDEQHEALATLNKVVRETEMFRAAEASGKMLAIPSGDGMALVFFTKPEMAAQCAVQVSRALASHPEVKVRMGIHSGPVSVTTDVNEKAQVTGAGMNIAQRVMDCGDAGHILVSRRMAEDLIESRHWQPLLHDLGEAEVKHGVIVSLFNLRGEDFGNAEPPQCLKHATAEAAPVKTSADTWRKILWLALPLILLGLTTAWWIISHRNAPPQKSSAVLRPSSAVAGTDKSIAVLPFDNLSDDKQNAYFADGVQDEILTNLAKIADLKVISRTSRDAISQPTERDEICARSARR